MPLNSPLVVWEEWDIKRLKVSDKNVESMDFEIAEMNSDSPFPVCDKQYPG